MLASLLVASVALAERPTGAAGPADQVALDLARELVDGRYDAAFARFDEPLRKLFGRADLERLMQAKRTERAPVRALVPTQRRNDADGVTVTVRVKWTRGAPSTLEATVRPDGRVAQLLLWDEDDPLYAYETKAKLRPPFRGTWTAANLERDPENHHDRKPNQRFAIDWVIRNDTGKTYRSDGKRNADYYAYGQPALSPSLGTVVVVVDGVPENPIPGQIDNYNIAGNHVVIDIGKGEYAMLLHLIPGSIRVRNGQRVGAGQVIGRVGNSGRCTEPNLQFQLADQPRLTDAHSLPAKFTRVLVDGEQAERAMPIYGTRLAPADHWNPRGPMREEDED